MSKLQYKYGDLIENFKVLCHMSRLLVTLALGLIGLSWQASAAVEAGLQQAIRVEIESLAMSGRLAVDNVHVVHADLTAEIYERRGFAPAWDDSKQIERLLEAIHASDRDGLSPADYHLNAIKKIRHSRLMGHERSVGERAVFDLLLTDSLIRLAYHLHFGKVDPETRGPTSAYGQLLNGSDPSTVIEEIIGSDELVNVVASMAPQSADYDRLKAQLQRHRSLARAGGWPEVPNGPTIRPDSNDPRLEILAARLAISGDLADADTQVSGETYDPALQHAVRRFQARHGLLVDGLVGRATLRALNVSIEQRINEIRLNLERARWRFSRQADDLILINVAGFRMYVIRDGEKVWTKKVIVGEEEARTPLFQSMLKRIVLNPNWTVPYSIASEEILPEIKKDPAYLERGRYRLFDRDGGLVDASAVDWSTIHAGNFPFTIVQQPGPANQLGQVKFMFPNKYSVCMHDTPKKLLFSRAGRALSHGCIRVDQPIRLAELLLGDEGWTPIQIGAQVDSGETRTVTLAQPLPVVILYWTAEVNDQGEMHFYKDIYERDTAVLKSLDSSL